VRAALHLAFELAAAALSPPRCAACDAAVPLLHAFCRACATTVGAAEPCADGVAAFAYGGAIARAVARLKYERRPDLGRPLGDLLARAVAAAMPALGQVVVPVPLHQRRLAERGYNQAQLLACRVASHLAAPVRPLALRRTRDTPQQATLDRSSREANLRDAFAVRHAQRIARQRVLLVDDVRTTGATLDACARALLRAGAAEVRWAAVAQTPSGGAAGLS
jgi:ComF family protein